MYFQSNYKSYMYFILFFLSFLMLQLELEPKTDRSDNSNIGKIILRPLSNTYRVITLEF